MNIMKHIFGIAIVVVTFILFFLIRPAGATTPVERTVFATALMVVTLAGVYLFVRANHSG